MVANQALVRLLLLLVVELVVVADDDDDEDFVFRFSVRSRCSSSETRDLRLNRLASKMDSFRR